MSPAAKKYFIALAVIQGVVLGATVFQVPFRGVDLGLPAHLGWLISVVVLSALGQTQFVIRSARLPKAPEDSEVLKQLFMTSVTFEVAAAGLSALGPHVVARAFQ